MTLKDPIVVAIIRGLYTAVGMGSLMWLTVYSATNDTRAAWIAGALAFLGALGFRGGVEGAIDQRKGPRPEGAEDLPPPRTPRVVHHAPRLDPIPQEGTCVDCGGDVPGPFMYCPAGSLGSPCHVAPRLDPLPAVDFDQPYHRDVRDGTPHPGQTSTGCQWCLAEKPTSP